MARFIRLGHGYVNLDAVFNLAEIEEFGHEYILVTTVDGETHKYRGFIEEDVFSNIPGERVPAAPGWYRLDLVGQGKNAGFLKVPVIAWDVSNDPTADWGAKPVCIAAVS